MQRSFQKYLFAERVYYSQPQPSGTTEAENLHNIMLLYCRRPKKKDRNGVEKDGTLLKSLTSVAILRNCPKFSGINTGFPVEKTATSENLVVSQRNEREESVLQSKQRHGTEMWPLGIKKALKNSSDTSQSYGSSQIAAALQEDSKRKEAMKKSQLRFNIINVLPDGKEKTKLLLELLHGTDETYSIIV